MANINNPQTENQIDFFSDARETEIDLVELFFHLLSRVRIILAAALIGAILMGAYSFILADPVYEATSKMYVLSAQDSAINVSDLQIGSYLTKDYLEVFNTWEVQAMVVQNLNLPYSYSRVRSMIDISNPDNTRMVYITASSTDPVEAANVANEFARVAQQYISEIMLTDEPSIMSEARIPTRPVSPHKTRNIILGFMGGAALMCVLLVITFMLDDKIKSSDDIRRYTDMTVLAIVPVNSAEESSSRAYRYKAPSSGQSVKKEGGKK